EQVADGERRALCWVIRRDGLDDPLEVVAFTDAGRSPYVFDSEVGRDLVDTPGLSRVLFGRHSHRRTACTSIAGRPRRWIAPTGAHTNGASAWSNRRNRATDTVSSPTWQTAWAVANHALVSARI